MTLSAIRADSLVLYKTHPARVLAVGEKLDIELEGGQSKRVRGKDVVLLHPGPLRSLGELPPREGDLSTAWELLQGGESHLAELAELIYEEYSPATAFTPFPADKATNVLFDADLRWSAGIYAAKHNVYFGTSFDASIITRKNT